MFFTIHVNRFLLYLLPGEYTYSPRTHRLPVGFLPHKMERQIDAIDNKYLEIQYYDNPHWYYLTDTEKVHQMHKVRLGRFTNHDSWLEIDGKEWRYPEIVTHIAEVRSLLDINETEHLLEDIDD